MTLHRRGTLVVGLALAMIWFSITAYVREPNWAPLSAVLSCAGAIALSVLTSERGWASPAAVFATVLTLFHAGILIWLVLGVPLSLDVWQADMFLGGAVLTGASTLVALGATSLSGGVLLGSLRVRRHPRAVEPATSSVTPMRSPALALVGLLALSVGLIGWLLALASAGGTSALSGGYGAWLAATQAPPVSLGLVYMLIGLGFPMVIASGEPLARRLAILAGTLWAAPALVIGLRGEVLLPLGAALVVQARRRTIAWRWRYALGAVGLLALGSFIREGRGADGTWSFSGLNPLRGLVEMGYSIRPTAEVWKWHVAWQEPYVGWRTYWATAERALRQLLGLSPLSASEDPNVFNATIAQRVGTIGGSPVAEAFHSAGAVGLVIVCAAIGIVLAKLDRLPVGPFRDAFVGGITWVLLLWVRNSFTPVLAQIGYLALLLLGAAALDSISRDGVKQDRARLTIQAI